jgi:hypothetical protein
VAQHLAGVLTDEASADDYRDVALANARLAGPVEPHLRQQQ